MTSNLSLQQILRMMQSAGVQEIRWDGSTIQTEPPHLWGNLHIDLRKTLHGYLPGGLPFILTSGAVT